MAETPASPLNCPNCGAPLPVAPGASLAVCLYCNTTSRVDAGPAGPQPVAETTLSDEDMAAVRQELINAGRIAARQLYIEKTGAAEDTASQAVDSLGRQISFDIIRNQLLTPYGMLLASLSTLIVAAAAVGGLLGRLHPLWAIVLVLFGGSQISYFSRSIRTTLTFARAGIAPAVTLKLAPIGYFKMGGQSIFTMKVLLEVQPEGETPFQAEILLPVRSENAARARPGAVLRVKYLRGSPPRVVYLDRKGAQSPDAPAEA